MQLTPIVMHTREFLGSLRVSQQVNLTTFGFGSVLYCIRNTRTVQRRSLRCLFAGVTINRTRRRFDPPDHGASCFSTLTSSVCHQTKSSSSRSFQYNLFGGVLG